MRRTSARTAGAGRRSAPRGGAPRGGETAGGGRGGRPRGGGRADGGMDGGLLAPPALPLLVGPRSALRAELVAPHDLHADARPPVAREGVVDAGAPALLALHDAK